LFEPDPSLPRSLERLLPGYAGFWAAATATFSLAVVAATIALATRQPTFRKPAWKALVVAAILIALAPIGAHSAGEFAAEYIPEIAMAAWLGFVAFGLLQDHAAAWVLFGAVYFGGVRSAELFSQPAPADRSAGWAVVVLVVLASAALLAGRRRPAAMASLESMAEPAGPLSPTASSEP
jgi:hypothetical protein